MLVLHEVFPHRRLAPRTLLRDGIILFRGSSVRTFLDDLTDLRFLYIFNSLSILVHPPLNIRSILARCQIQFLLYAGPTLSWETQKLISNIRELRLVEDLLLAFD